MSPSANRNIVIKDACIFFDLISLGLLDLFYQLETDVFTTPQVIEEITDPVQYEAIQVYVSNGRLQIDEEAAYDVIADLVNANRRLSATDASVLELAQRKAASVLSSDFSLRKETLGRGLPVKGLLWILEELHSTEKITSNALLIHLDQYQEINAWAPKKEIAALKLKYIPL